MVNHLKSTQPSAPIYRLGGLWEASGGFWHAAGKSLFAFFSIIPKPRKGINSYTVVTFP